MLRGGKIVAFALGAVAMIPVVSRLGHAAFAAPAAIIVLATWRSYESLALSALEQRATRSRASLPATPA
jgi:hypothetical protein